MNYVKVRYMQDTGDPDGDYCNRLVIGYVGDFGAIKKRIEKCVKADKWCYGLSIKKAKADEAKQSMIESLKISNGFLPSKLQGLTRMPIIAIIKKYREHVASKHMGKIANLV